MLLAGMVLLANLTVVQYSWLFCTAGGENGNVLCIAIGTLLSPEYESDRNNLPSSKVVTTKYCQAWQLSGLF